MIVFEEQNTERACRLPLGRSELASGFADYDLTLVFACLVGEFRNQSGHQLKLVLSELKLLAGQYHLYPCRCDWHNKLQSLKTSVAYGATRTSQSLGWSKE